MATDPVCGMEVDEQAAPAKTTYQGTIYFFCSEACKMDFMEDPERFIEGEDLYREVA